MGTGDDEQARLEFHGFLKKFSQLRSAEVPITRLVGLHPEESEEISDLVPDTLEELCLQWDNSEMNGFWEYETQSHDCVRHLLADLQSHSPHLKRIAIWRPVVSPEDREYFAKECAELKAACAEVGIDRGEAIQGRARINSSCSSPSGQEHYSVFRTQGDFGYSPLSCRTSIDSLIFNFFNLI